MPQFQALLEESPSIIGFYLKTHTLVNAGLELLSVLDISKDYPGGAMAKVSVLPMQGVQDQSRQGN